jgi:UPF0271 protein
VDLNADLGEGFGRWTLGDDDGLLEVITSANVACGFHAGDPAIMERVCRNAAERGVTIGAQVGYRDLAGFGRRFLDVGPDDLRAEVLYQIGALQAFAGAAGTRVAYIKPHGALYNAVFSFELQAEAVVAAVTAYDSDLVVLGQPGSKLLELASAAGLPVVAEAFADRAYRPDGTLVDRREPGAVLDDEDEVSGRAVALAITGRVFAADGTPVSVDPGSICVHGDTAGAVRLVRAVRTALEQADIDVAPFVR